MKIVYLTTENLYGKINSGSLKCSYSNLKMLKKISDNDIVHIFLDCNKQKLNNKTYEFKRQETKVSKLFLALLNRRFIFPQTENEIVQIIIKHKPEIVFFEGPYWCYVIEKLKKKLNKTVFVLFMHNIEKEYYRNLKCKSFSYKLLYKVTCNNERKSVNCANRIVVLNNRDERLLLKTYNRKSDMLLPISMEDIFDDRKINYLLEDNTLLFIGSLFPPNYDGIVWFIDNVMKELKEFKLVIVGKNFEKVRSKLERSNVSVIGNVDNLEEYYYRYPVLVMPILYGSGMKVKTAEALMYGKTIIATEEALEGYNAVNISGIYECNSKEEFIDTIRSVYKGKEYRNVRVDVRKHFLENFETNVLCEQFGRKLRQWMIENVKEYPV